VKNGQSFLGINKLSQPHLPTPRRKRKALRTETLSHKFEKATERSSFQILGGVVVLVCKLGDEGEIGAKCYSLFDSLLFGMACFVRYKAIFKQKL